MVISLTWTYTYGDISDRFYEICKFDDTILSNHIRVLGSSQYAEVLFDLKVDENESIWKIIHIELNKLVNGHIFIIIQTRSINYNTFRSILES